MAKKIKITIQEQIKLALDGRTQRWLSMQIQMPEDTLSKKMNGIGQFTQEEVDVIGKRLSTTIQIN